MLPVASTQIQVPSDAHLLLPVSRVWWAMAYFKLSKSSRLLVIILISFSFFIAEIAVGFSTHSLALIADSFHYLSDLIGFIVALVALKVSEREDSPGGLSSGCQRTQLLGAFFNGVFLVALGLSIFLQSIERFVTVQQLKRPELVLMMGCIGLTLNIISALFLHQHDHSNHSSKDDNARILAKLENGSDSSVEIEIPIAARTVAKENEHGSNIAIPTITTTSAHPHHNHSNDVSPQPTTTVTPAQHAHDHDLNMLGVLLHILSDAINNIGVIIAALIILLTHSPHRYYADPATSLFISLIIFLFALPLVKNSGSILLQAAAPGPRRP
ncbi:MAG: hypothetical protein Q9181_008167 [Wetmoreana brouardii]